MPQGLQIFDEDGISILNTNNRTLKTLGLISIVTSRENTKTIITGGIDEGDKFWYILLDEISPPFDVTCTLTFKPNNIGIMQANVKLTGNTSVVQYGGDIVTAMYGVY